MVGTSMRRQELEARIRKALRAIDGVFESPGTFYEDDAYWVNGKEIAHIHQGLVGLRLTRQLFSANRKRLRADRRIERRAPSSDWIMVRCSSSQDLSLVRELAELAADAHRPPPGIPTKPPPIGADLERRRRFH